MLNNIVKYSLNDLFCISLIKIEDFSNNMKSARIKDIHNDEIKLIENACKKRQNEFIAGRIVAKFGLKMINKQLPNSQELYIGYTKEGAPYFDEKTFISISHDGEFAAAVCCKKDIFKMGLDIHHLSDEATNVKKSFLNEHEIEYISQIKCCDENFLFSYLWCAKESACKLFCRGLSIINDIILTGFERKNRYNEITFHFKNNTLKAYILHMDRQFMSFCVIKEHSLLFEGKIDVIIQDLCL